ncbi:hypothetical protein MB02_06165 [Croceicoccus estronivorus]|uniref:hypothetical protein n=1 Tax=Croceicoccus estronivorus TaxID=1172626 RepID=UPI00083286D7|nr:hypothetical protein [Croceicoccus estronivorus]OCC25017.1 hypothetical protein MB02_06165 [Croceicoccus estronivorus]
MTVLFEQYWWLFVIALLIGVIIAWRVFGKGGKARIDTSLTADVLQEGAAPAKRNQALIDAPRTSAQPEMPPPTPQGMSGVGTAVAAAVQHQEHERHEAEHRKDEAEAEVSTTERASDDLTRIKGLGPKLAKLLQSLGITRFEQIAGWNDADIDQIDAELGNFRGRIRRDNWVEQAGYLANGDTAGFEGRFGKL